MEGQGNAPPHPSTNKATRYFLKACLFEEREGERLVCVLLFRSEFLIVQSELRRRPPTCLEIRT